MTLTNVLSEKLLKPGEVFLAEVLPKLSILLGNEVVVGRATASVLLDGFYWKILIELL